MGLDGDEVSLSQPTSSRETKSNGGDHHSPTPTIITNPPTITTHSPTIITNPSSLTNSLPLTNHQTNPPTIPSLANSSPLTIHHYQPIITHQLITTHQPSLPIITHHHSISVSFEYWLFGCLVRAFLVFWWFEDCWW